MRQGLMSHIFKGSVMAAAGLAFAAGQALGATELTVYTAVEAEDLKRYAEAVIRPAS